MEDFVTDIFEIGGTAVGGAGGLLTDGVQTLVSVFWTPGVDGAQGSLTIVGTALAIGAGVGALYFLFKLIKNWLSRVKG